MLRATLKALGVTLIVVSGQACWYGDFLDPLSDELRCQDVCESFETCVDPSFDVAACRSRCLDETAESDALRERLEDCDDCLDDSFCGDGIYPCSGVCAGLVP